MCWCSFRLLDLFSTGRLHWRRYVPLAIAAVVYFALRRQALGAFVGGMPTGTPVPQLASDVLRAVGFYLVEAVIPLQLCAYIPAVPTGAGYLLAGVLALVLGGALIVLAWRRGRWPLAFLVAWFFITLAPSLTVIVRRSASAPVADRYLYVPSVASCLLLSWAVVHLTRRLQLPARWTAATFAILSFILGVQALFYTRVWADDLSFWSDVAAKVPNDALPHRELATALLNRNRLDEADRELQRALAAPSDAVRAGDDLQRARQSLPPSGALPGSRAGLRGRHQAPPAPDAVPQPGYGADDAPRRRATAGRPAGDAARHRPGTRGFRTGACASATFPARRKDSHSGMRPRRTRCSGRCCSRWGSATRRASISKPRCVWSRPAPSPRSRAGTCGSWSDESNAYR